MLRPWSILLLALSSMGCVEIGEDGIELRPRVPYESNVRDVGVPLEWHGEPVSVDVERGFVEVVGDPDVEKVVVTSHALTWAGYGDVEDARAINDDILSTARVESVDGTIRVSCGLPSGDHGSAEANATQCDLRVLIPAPPGAEHVVTVRTGLGDVFLQRLTTPPMEVIDLWANGRVEAWQLVGNVVASAGSNDVEVTPYAGGVVDVRARIALAGELNSAEGAGDAKHTTGTKLHLPPDFAAQTLDLFSDDGELWLAQFPDLGPTSTTRPGANPAALVRAHADWGHVELVKLVEHASRTRTSALGTIEQKP